MGQQEQHDCSSWGPEPPSLALLGILTSSSLGMPGVLKPPSVGIPSVVIEGVLSPPVWVFQGS